MPALAAPIMIGGLCRVRSILYGSITSVTIAMSVGSLQVADAIAKDDNHCRRNGEEVTLAVEQQTEGEVTSCSVVLRTGADARQVLWTFENDLASCRRQSQGFKSILEQEAWDCSIDDTRSDTDRVPDSREEVPSLPEVATGQREPERGVDLAPIPELRRQYSYLCERDQSRREIWLETPSSAATLPCQVWRDGDDLDEKVIWQARSQTGFCTARMSDMLSKWVSDGWRCSVDTMPISAERRELGWNDARPFEDGAFGKDGRGETVHTTSRRPAILAADSIDLEGKLLTAAEDLKLDVTGRSIFKDGQHHILWTGNRPALRSRLTEDLHRLSQAYDGNYTIRNGVIRSIYGEGRADAVVLISYRTAGRALRFLLNVYRQDEGQYHLADSIILSEDWISRSDPISGQVVSPDNDGLR